MTKKEAEKKALDCQRLNKRPFKVVKVDYIWDKPIRGGKEQDSGWDVTPSDDVKVGMRLKLSVSLPYSDHGVRGNHRIVSIIEVTAIDEGGWNASYKTVEVISEEGKPSFADDALNSTGGFSIPMFLQGKNPSLEAL